MKTYQLSPAYYAKLKQRLFLTAVPIVVAAGVVGFLAGSFQGASFGYASVFIVMTGIFFVFTIPRNYRQQSEIGHSYKITIEEGAITRTQSAAQEITVTRAGVARITEQPGKGLGVYAINGKQRFGIPATLEGYDELRATLASWHRIDTVVPTGFHWQALAVPATALAIIGLFVIVILSNDKLVVTLAGMTALVVSVASAVVLWRNPQVDAKTKSRLWLISIPLLGLIGKMIYTLVS
jgi:hypothetical protein